MRGWPSLLALMIACGGSGGGEPAPPATRAAEAKPTSESASASASESVSQSVSESVSVSEAESESESEAESVSVSEAESVEVARVMGLPGSVSTSIGGPNDGRLEGAVALPLRGPGFRFNPRRAEEARYGAVEMVQALIAAAARVERELPGGELTINDLGYQEGGPIPHHGSHRAGRDVDTLFYLLDRSGHPFPSVGAPIDPRGEGTDYRDLAAPEDDIPVRIDLPRTWLFVRALLEHETESPVQRIFVVEHLRTMLLDHARSVGAPEATVQRFAELTCQPSYPHDDHFHIRFFCSSEDIQDGCEDESPIYPWRRSELRADGVRPVRNRPRPDRPMAPTTSADEARDEAGELHPSVTAFLEARKAWASRPHPGRRWCR